MDIFEELARIYDEKKIRALQSEVSNFRAGVAEVRRAMYIDSNTGDWRLASDFDESKLPELKD